MKGKTAKRSLGAELAAGTVQRPSSAVVKLEQKVLEKAKGKGEESLQLMRQAASIKSIGSLKKFFQRCTRKRFPPLKFLRDLKVDEFEGLKYTHRAVLAKEGEQRFQERFLIYADKNVAIFGTDTQLNIFRLSKTLIFDGSFKYRPQDTYQIYRGFGFVKETHCVPLITVLMRGKERKMYEKIWKKVFEAVQPLGKLRAKFANFDYEPAAYKSFKVQFPTVATKMCSFHVKQALNRKVQSVGMMPAYKEDATVKKIVRQIGALQLTPQSEWEKCMDLIKQGIEVSLSFTPTSIKKLLELLDYYKSPWIKLGSFFCLFGVEGPRTTNPAESYHARQQYHFRKRARLGEWIVRNRELHYREEMETQDVLEKGSNRMSRI